MHTTKILLLVLGAAMLAWLVSNPIHGQTQATGTLTRIIGLGQSPLPTDATGNPYLPMRDDRQLAFGIENWQSTGEVMTLLLNGTLLPRQVTICGNRLSLIQASLKTSQHDENPYFAVTVNGTRVPVPDEGCYSITPVAYLRIKGITTKDRTTLPNVNVWARY
jgi:hypothetical protein